MKTITKQEYIILQGLIALTSYYNEITEDIDKVALKITGEDENIGHTYDILSGFRELDDGLRLIGIKVEDDKDNLS